MTIMLASITLLLAWSGFQASKWGGVQAINFSDAGKARTDSNALTDIGGTLTSIDVALFVAWLEEAEPALAARDIPAATTGEGLAPFLYQSFPDRLEVAVEDWARQRIAGNDDVPLPFQLDSYVNESFVQAQQLRDDATDFGEAARGNNQQSDIYVLATVVFAAALFPRRAMSETEETEIPASGLLRGGGGRARRRVHCGDPAHRVRHV